MPSGISKEQQAYVRSVFTELLDVRGMTQTQLSEKLGGLDQSRISKIRRDGKTSLQILMLAAKLARRPNAEIANIVGFDLALLTDRPPPSDDPKFGTFMMRLGDVPGLRSWLTDNPGAATLAEVWSGIQVYEATPTLSRANDGQPLKGWSSFFGDLRAGVIGLPTSKGGDAVAVLALETAERPDLPHTHEPKPRKPRTSKSKAKR